MATASLNKSVTPKSNVFRTIGIWNMIHGFPTGEEQEDALLAQQNPETFYCLSKKSLCNYTV